MRSRERQKSDEESDEEIEVECDEEIEVECDEEIEVVAMLCYCCCSFLTYILNNQASRLLCALFF